MANELALTLLVTKILTDHHYATLTTNDLALVANLLHAWINLHVIFLFVRFVKARIDLLVTVNNSALS